MENIQDINSDNYFKNSSKAKTNKGNNYDDKNDSDEYIKNAYFDRWGEPMPIFTSNEQSYNGKQKKNKQSTEIDSAVSLNKEERPKKILITYKYSKFGKDDLHETVIVDDLPYFLKYDREKRRSELIENIIENCRILRPPEREEYPYTPYEFESREEMDQYIEKAKKITIDELYIKCKLFFKKYVDQEEHIINLLAADAIWTYFQDLFPVTHYTEGVGTNDVGKSSIGYTFEYTGYRVIKGTAISGANYYRILGTEEPGQCTIIEDEGDSISEDQDKIRVLKSGYECNGKIPKINMNSRNQEQKWFRTYGYKMILAEKSLSQSKAKGLVDRTFSFHCRPGKVKYSIKEVVSENINKNARLRHLYKELLDFRKLMICYRLVHYKDELPNIETGLKNRDNELCQPSLQLFYGTESLKEIIKTLEVFVRQRRERKLNSLEAAIYPIIKKHLFSKVGLDYESSSYSELKQNARLILVDYSDIWHYIILGGIDGYYDDRKKNQYETIDYSTLFINSLSRFISDKFGAKLDKRSHGSILIFDIEKLEQFEFMYGDQLEKDVKIQVEVVKEDQDYNNENENKEKTGNDCNNDSAFSYDGHGGNDGNDGIRRCVGSDNSKLDTENFLIKNDLSEDYIGMTHREKPSEQSLPSLLSQSYKCNYCDSEFFTEKEHLKHCVNYHEKKPAHPDRDMIQVMKERDENVELKGNPWE